MSVSVSLSLCLCLSLSLSHPHLSHGVVLLSDIVSGLQTQLNVLFNTAKRIDLIVNVDKSNITVLGMGAVLIMIQQNGQSPSFCKQL